MKRPNTRQMKIADRNQILALDQSIVNSQEGIKIALLNLR